MLTFLNGDCLEKMKDISSNSIDCFICDLPYGCLTGGGGKEKAARKAKGSGDHIAGCDWDIPIDLDKLWEQVKRLAKNEHTPVLMFCTTKFGYDLIQSNPSWFRYDIVWEKTNAVGFLCANKMPMRSHEMIYVFSKAGAYYERKDIEGDFPKSSGGRSGTDNVYGGKYKPVVPDNEGKRCIRSVIKVPNKKVKGGHATQKPNELYKMLIERYCPSGGTILDPTAGSFTSCFVANELGRNAIGIEMNKTFFDKAEAKRIDITENA
jgi:site-specific DNA-methyltransferase (adenine-specific)